MTWNHRVVRHHVEIVTTWGDESYDELSIHDVYYADDGKIEAWSPAPSYALGGTADELLEDVLTIATALTRPILDETELPSA